MIPKFVALIPARKGSKGIPHKNIKEFAGRPLLLWVAEAACNCELIDSVYVMTDSVVITDWVLSQTYFDSNGKLNVIDRKAENATDKAPMADLMVEFAGRIEFDNLVVIQATSPLLEVIDLYMGIEKYQFSDYDSLIPVVRQHDFIWEERDGYAYPVNHELLIRPNRQDFKGILVENGAFIITSRKVLLKTKARLSGKVGCYHMPEDTYLQIDEMSDWVAIEAMLKYRKGLL
jgi:N-acylneuraminate cytidylyltransferase